MEVPGLVIEAGEAREDRSGDEEGSMVLVLMVKVISKGE